MKFFFAIILSTLLTLVAGSISAEELTFPQTEQEIVEALSIKDGRTVFEDVEYISENDIILPLLKFYHP